MLSSELKVNLRITNKEVQIRRNNGAARTERLRYEDNDLERRTLRMLADMRRSRRLEGDEVKILGEWLYRLLLEYSVGDELNRIVSDTTTFLRVELEFEDPGSHLAALPWEYLRRPDQQDARGYFLALHDQIALTRLPQVECRLLGAIGKKAKILLVANSPVDLAPLVFGQLIKQFKSKPLKSLFETAVLDTPYLKSADRDIYVAKNKKPQATFANFKEALTKFEPHIVHFLGHGKYEGKSGKIAFAEDNYNADWKTGDEIAQELKDCPSVKLAFLQACESAREDLPTSSFDWSDKHQALTSVAGCIVQSSKMPAIVAMQSNVENDFANTFASTFYRSLVEHKSIYQAVQIARTEARKQDRASDAADHFSCVPVLYLDSCGDNDNGILFPESVETANQSSEQLNVAPIQCPWCPKMIETKTRGDKEPDICSKCGNRLRCPNCRRLISRVDPDQDEVYCEYGCDQIIQRRKKSPVPPLPPTQTDNFKASPRLDIGISGVTNVRQ